MWKFKTNEESDKFCNRIAAKMVENFGIHIEEARGRINRQWEGDDFLDKKDFRYHEMSKNWAFEIYYGMDSRWWKNPKGLTPRPFP